MGKLIAPNVANCASLEAELVDKFGVFGKAVENCVALCFLLVVPFSFLCLADRRAHRYLHQPANRLPKPSFPLRPSSLPDAQRRPGAAGAIFTYLKATATA
jgi:hypothetical protein